MKRPVAGMPANLQRVSLRFDPKIPATTRPRRRVVGKKSVPAGVQNIKITPFRPRYPPGGNPVVAFSFRIQLHIDITIFFIKETQVTGSAWVDIKVFDLR